MNPFLEVSFLFGVATLLAFVMRRFRLPLIVSYLLTGVVAGPLLLGFIHPGEELAVFAELGVAALLFVIGLTLSPRVLVEMGSTAVVTGLGQCLLTSIPAFFLARLLGFETIPSLYIAITLTLSSTIVVSKILSDQKALGSLHGKISIGFLLVQDIAAAFALLAVTSLSRGEGAIGLVLSFGKTIVLATALYIMSRWILPRLAPVFATSQDVLFLFTLGWGIGVAGSFYAIGLSLELGALAAGIALASSPYHHEMSTRMRVVRDFFLVVFFALLGVQVGAPLSGMGWWQVGVFLLFVLVGKPLIVMLMMSLLGFQRKTSFLTGLSIAQMSEFSFILLALGFQVAHVSQEVMSVLALVGIVSMALSSLLLVRAEAVYLFLEKWLFWVPRGSLSRVQTGTGAVAAPRIFLIGCHRLGAELLPSIQRWKQPYAVVDFDPGIVRALTERGIRAWYGDASEAEFLEEIGLSEADMVISTVPEAGVHRAILSKVRRGTSGAIVVLVASSVEQSLKLYKEGATYVINLHDVAGNYAALILDRCQGEQKRFALERRKHVAQLKKHEGREILPSSDLHHRWTLLH